ncbi:hypothetical protein ABZT47_29595 [Sphaerisporangium sp. NPDC005289]|uniref:hypothetical protein n=1 Tax=Sphaerisporangium sp. NPDC005289 TaxID=3155247 RepID=UPI0033A43A3C
MTGIEDRLRDALTAKAETVRDDGEFHLLPAALGRERRWRAPVAMAAAMAAVAVGTIVGTRTVAVAPPAPAARQASPAPYAGPLAPPIKQVWPRAVHEIPVKGAGDLEFMPEAFVSDRVVVGRGLIRSRLDGIWSYDVGTRAFTRIAPFRGRAVMDSAPVYGDGYVAWPALNERMTEVWAVPVTGGVPRRIASVPAAMTSEASYEGIDLAIADGMAVWSPSDGGVYRVPLKGGRASLVSGTAGYYLVEWPWAGRPAKKTMTDAIPRPMEHLKNVVTGALSDAAAPAGRSAWQDCGVSWCFNGAEAWRRDGTGLRALPGIARGVLYSGRFVLLSQKDRDGRRANAVYDIATGRAGLLFLTPARPGDKAYPTLYLQEGVMRYRTGRGTQVVVDLTAAGR